MHGEHDARREHEQAGHGAAVLGYGALAVACLLVFAAGVVLAVHVMLAKS